MDDVDNVIVRVAGPICNAKNLPDLLTRLHHNCSEFLRDLGRYAREREPKTTVLHGCSVSSFADDVGGFRIPGRATDAQALSQLVLTVRCAGTLN